jgi:HSP20 family molecular chaperone IbpA
MNQNQEVKNRDHQGEVQTRSQSEAYLLPAVDIYEDAGGITLKADLPGVSRDRLDVQVEGNNLTIDAEVALTMPENMKALHADLNTTRFRRNFTLSNELETENIKADIKDGVLKLYLAKRAEHQPRKIEVSTG